MRFKNSLVQQGVFVIAFPLICQVIVVLLLAGNVERIRDEQLKTAHARDMISMSHSLVLDTIHSVYEMHVDSEQVGMLGQESSVRETSKIALAIAEMKRKAEGNAVESRLMLSVDSSASALLECLSWAAVEQGKGRENWKRVNDRCYETMKESSKNFVQSLEELIDSQEPLIKKDTTAANSQVVLVLFCFALINFLLGLGLGLFYISRITGALKRVDENRILLGERKPLLPEISAHDELMQLDLAVHSAAASLTAAFDAGARMIREAGNLICSLDNDLLFLEANPAASKIIGLESEQLVGRSLREFVDGEVIEKFREAQNSRVESKLEVILNRADGSKIHTQWAVKPGDAPVALFCVVQDITEKKRREGLRQRFLDAVRSSLRAPIASIADALQQVTNSDKIAESEGKARNDLVRANRSARQCILLIDVLLDAQSAESGTIKIEPSSVSFGQVVNDSIELVKNIADKKGVEIVRELKELEIVCDSFKVTQTIVNFLSNAIKFSPEGGKIFVAIEDKGDAVEVSVTDEGPGIAQEYREKIFKPFVQVPGEKAKEGTGLGLAICKQIIEGHRGEIGVRQSSRGATGSTFWFRLQKSFDEKVLAN
jgi:PAS domain S-box-containing protein